MTTASKIYTMVYKMVIFYENNKSIQIKRFLSKSTRVPHAKFYICKKVIFFENFDYRATLKGKLKCSIKTDILLTHAGHASSLMVGPIIQPEVGEIIEFLPNKEVGPIISLI